MKALLCEKHGLPNSLVIREIANLEPSENEVVIAVKACSANFPDTLIIQNLYQFKPSLPFSPGAEVAGLVIKKGERVRDFEIGDAVFALCGWGGFAEEVVVESTRVFKMLPGMNYITAASLMYNYGTSYHALKDRAQLKSGEKILILGAAGGVGLAAVELAKSMGATVLAAASSDSKLKKCAEKGANCLVNYSDANWKDQVMELSGGKGVDVVYDPVGDQYTEPALRCMTWGGRYLVVGFAAGHIPQIPMNLPLLKGCAITGVFWGRFAQTEMKKSAENLKELAVLFEKGKIGPSIYKYYTLDHATQALQDLMDRKVEGKAVVLLDTFENASKVPIDKHLNSSTQKEFKDFDEIIAHVGQNIGQSAWHQISQEKINLFADATDDHQWIHTQPEKAAQGPFGSTIAHGYLTLSLLPKMMDEIYCVKNSQLGINYGTEKVRFLSPVKVGAKLRSTALLKHASKMPNNGLKMIIEAKVEIKGEEKPACFAELITVIYR